MSRMQPKRCLASCESDLAQMIADAIYHETRITCIVTPHNPHNDREAEVVGHSYVETPRMEISKEKLDFLFWFARGVIVSNLLAKELAKERLSATLQGLIHRGK